jgi:hypothetical protein
MNRLLISAIGLVLFCGCGSSNTRTVRVALPPRVDLHSYPLVGLVTFSTNRQGLDRLGTQQFLQAVQTAQPGTRVIELGPEAQVLASVHASAWTPAALAAIKEMHHVDVVVVGRLEVEQSRPSFGLSTIMKQASAQVDVKAALNCRLLETASGATMWADGSSRTANLAHADVSARSGHIGANDPDAVYGGMVDQLVCDVTDAFREHYVLRRVPKEQVVASAE